MNPRTRISLALPAAALLFSISIFGLGAYLSYRNLKKAEQPGTDYISLGQFAFPKDRLPSVVLMGTAMNVHGPIVAFNVPAIAIDGFINATLGRDGNWFQQRLGLHLWRVLAYPFLALPAWWFVGRGFDGFSGLARLRKLDLITSVTLTSLAFFLSAGLRFGLSAADREGQDSLGWFIGGLALWGALFAIPAVAWIRVKVNIGRATARPGLPTP